MKAIIPTGGRGTRMRPLTFSSNKHFIPVANKPLIYYPIETVADAGIKEVAITYDPLSEAQAKHLLGDGSRWGLKFIYVLQEKPAGLANIFQVCEEYLGGEDFFLHLGDNIFVDGIGNFVDYFKKNKPNGLVPMVHHKENRRMGVPYFDDKGRLSKYIEKPEDPPHDFAIPGLYFFDSEVFKCFRGKDAIELSSRGELEISLPYQWLIDHGYRVDVLEYKGKWLDPGKFDDWLDANQYLLEKLADSKIDSVIDSSVTLENRVTIGEGCELSNCHIKGPVILGKDVTIKDSFVGPYTSIGDGVEISGSHVENSVIMQKVKIQDIKSPIDSSLIGAESEIVKGDGPTNSISLFIGEKSHIEI